MSPGSETSQRQLRFSLPNPHQPPPDWQILRPFLAATPFPNCNIPAVWYTEGLSSC